MALELFFTIQKYIVAILLAIVIILWYKLKKEGIESLFTKPLIINFTILLTLPFILIILPGLPSNLVLGIEAVGVFILSLILFLFSFKNFKIVDKQRTGELEELLEKPKHPIALEFARKIVEPQILQLENEKNKLKRFEKKVYDNLRAKESEIETRVNNANKTIKQLEENENKLMEKIKVLTEEKNELKNYVEEFFDVKDETNALKKDVEKLKIKYKKKGVELSKEKSRLKKWEREIEKKGKELMNYDKIKENIKKKEKILSLKEQEVKKREKKLQDFEESLEDDKNETAVLKKKFDSEMVKLEDSIDAYYKKREKLLLKESDLDEKEEEIRRLENSLKKKEKQLADQEGELLRKEREIIAR